MPERTNRQKQNIATVREAEGRLSLLEAASVHEALGAAARARTLRGVRNDIRRVLGMEELPELSPVLAGGEEEEVDRAWRT